MPTYVTLFKHTEDAKGGIEQVPDVFEKAAEHSQSMGIEIQDVYFGSIGEYDGLGVFEAPDGETAETLRLALEREGMHHFENYEVFEAGEYFEMIKAGTS